MHTLFSSIVFSRLTIFINIFFLNGLFVKKILDFTVFVDLQLAQLLFTFTINNIRKFVS